MCADLPPATPPAVELQITMLEGVVLEYLQGQTVRSFVEIRQYCSLQIGQMPVNYENWLAFTVLSNLIAAGMVKSHSLAEIRREERRQLVLSRTGASQLLIADLQAKGWPSLIVFALRAVGAIAWSIGLGQLFHYRESKS